MELAGSWVLYVSLWAAGLVCGVFLALRIGTRMFQRRADATTVITGYSGEQVSCPVCANECRVFDVVDFSKCCEEPRGKFLVPTGIPVYYYSCKGCQYCFSPWISGWTQQEFSERIYNDDYILVDPDYLDARPRDNARSLITMFGEHGRRLRHLDYGGGAGVLSRLLNEAGWQSTCYDPFANSGVALAGLGQFDLITSYEVIEHVPDMDGLMQTLSALLAADGIVLFNTLVNDDWIIPGKRLTWWYASPRNGHISLHSRKSLALMGAKQNFKFVSFTEGNHMYYRTIPAWASHLMSGSRSVQVQNY